LYKIILYLIIDLYIILLILTKNNTMIDDLETQYKELLRENLNLKEQIKFYINLLETQNILTETKNKYSND
jgi:hypothetical protein